ncbi:hypothetical protein ACTNAF_25715, partial [Escherichia coli]
VILFNSRFRSYGAQGVLKKHPFCGAFLVFWGFKFLSIELASPGKPLQKERGAAAIDTVGSHTLCNACAGVRYGSIVAACGMAQGMDLMGKRLVRTVLIFTESSDQLSRATDRVPGLPASPGYVQ